MKLIISLLLLLLISASAQASPIFSNYKDTAYFNFEDVTGWNFTQPGDAIIRVTHTLDSGTQINESFILRSGTINVGIGCDWSYAILRTCNFHIDSGNISSDVTTDDLALIQSVSVIADVTNYENGSTGFGLGFPSSFTPKASIFIPELAYDPALILQGSATQKADLKIETTAITDYQDYQEQQQEGTNFLDVLLNSWTIFYSIFSTLFYILKLLFYDHPILTFAFVEIFALMYSINAKDMWGWWSRFIEVHEKAYNWGANLIGKFVNILTSIIDALKPV